MGWPRAEAPDDTRYEQAQGGKTVFYIGPDFEYVLHPDGGVEERSFIGDYLVLEQTDGERRLRYLHPDRQGSIATITNEAGAVIARHGYDALTWPTANRSSGHEQVGQPHARAFG